VEKILATRSRDRRFVVLVILGAMTAALVGIARSDAPLAEAAPTPNGYALVQDVTTANFPRMVDFAMIPGSTNEAVVVSQQQAIVRRVWLNGAFPPAIYGNLSDRVKVAGNEEGLLSIAFSPNFASDERVYVYYTSLTCTAPVIRCARISRFPVVSNDMVETMETVVLEIDQEMTDQSNHNGGRILFGPDGYLYLSIGDGGSGGDPLETGQDHTDLLGSVLRINVTGQLTYSIPADNPFVGVAGDDRVWAYGFRNPWRYSFDRVSGDLWLGDVGQGSWEEVNKVVAGGNYGWDCYEGNAVFETTDCSTPPTPFIFPRAVYSLSGAPCAVVGGYVYRGTLLPEIYGWYVYGDNCSGQIWAVNPADGSDPVQLVDTDINIGSFAELPNGELLVLRIFQPVDSPGIYRLTCAATPDTDSDGQGNACDLDDDNDGFSDAIESYVGTDVLLDCGTNAWPADINNDGASDISDISLAGGSFGKAVPPAPRRHNIAPDPPDGVVDITDIGTMGGFFGKSCT
jgi:glucose/arabinose dehydrogenase